MRMTSPAGFEPGHENRAWGAQWQWQNTESIDSNLFYSQFIYVVLF